MYTLQNLFNKLIFWCFFFQAGHDLVIDYTVYLKKIMMECQCLRNVSGNYTWKDSMSFHLLISGSLRLRPWSISGAIGQSHRRASLKETVSVCEVMLIERKVGATCNTVSFKGH